MNRDEASVPSAKPPGPTKPRSELLSRLAEAAPDVDAAPTLGRRKQLEDLFGDLCERAYEHLAVQLPPLIQDRVPCAYRFLVRYDTAPARCCCAIGRYYSWRDLRRKCS